MIQPEPAGNYLIELCSGELRRWRYLGSDAQARNWWRDCETGREFSEDSVMYSWRIVGADDPDAGG